MIIEEFRIQERMMRIGVEVRNTDMSQVLDTHAKYREIAINTLTKSKKTSSLASSAVEELFKRQNIGQLLFYMMEVAPNKQQIFKICRDELHQLSGFCGFLPDGFSIPRITKLPKGFKHAY